MEPRIKYSEVVRLILEQKGNVLLLKQHKHRGNLNTLIGGKVEKGERPEEAIIREAKEEVGIDIKEADLKLLHYYRLSKKEYVVKLHVYTVKNWQGKVRNMEPHKFKCVRWWPIWRLPKKLTPLTRSALNLLIKRFVLR